jgi:hypothetical protein
MAMFIRIIIRNKREARTWMVDLKNYTPVREKGEIPG